MRQSRDLRVSILTAFALAYSSLGAAQDNIPRERITGMVLPLLPGETYVPLSHGCGIIRREGDHTMDYARYRWMGPCRYGLVHDAGFLNYFDKNTGKWTGLTKPAALDSLGDYYLGRRLPHVSDSSVGLPLHPGRTDGIIISVPPDPQPYRSAERESHVGPDVFDRGGISAVRLLAIRHYNRARENGYRSVYLRKEYCNTSIDIPDLGSKVYKYKLAKDLLGTVAHDHADFTQNRKNLNDRLRPFCEEALARRTSGTGRGALGWTNEIFSNVDYGYWFAVVVVNVATIQKPDGTSANTMSIEKIELCPTLNNIASCEPLWRAAVAPFKAELEQIRPLAEKERVTLIGQIRQLYAPIAQAWRTKAKELAAR